MDRIARVGANEKYDVVIVGAGPAGLHCAEILASNGVKVLVLEKNKIIGKKVCAGGLTSKTLRFDIPLAITEKQFNSYRVHYYNRSITINHNEVILATVEREKLGKWLYEKALQAGAQIITGNKVYQVSSNKVITEKREFEFYYLVGADGTYSLVRRWLRIPTRHWLIVTHYIVSEDFPEIEWFIEPSLLQNGFAWIFPYKGRATVGVGGHSEETSPKKLVAILNKWLRNRGISIDSKRFYTSRINIDYRGWCFGNVFLIGDASGLASPITGEGIYSALVSGEEVARKIINPSYQMRSLRRLIQWWKYQNLLYKILHHSKRLRDLYYLTGYFLAKFNPARRLIEKAFVV